MIARSRNRHRSGGLESAAAEAAMLIAPITGVPEAGRSVHLTRPHYRQGRSPQGERRFLLPNYSPVNYREGFVSLFGL